MARREVRDGELLVFSGFRARGKTSGLEVGQMAGQIPTKEQRVPRRVEEQPELGQPPDVGRPSALAES